MKLLWGDKDGGPESCVWCWGFESKRFFSVILLKFGEGSRNAYHSHAFNSVSWMLSGGLIECFSPLNYLVHVPSIVPVVTRRDTYHQVHGVNKVNWVLTFRGPWADRWRESTPADGEYLLTHGRKRV